jgi:DNA helicase HerA-like ATPase
MTDNGLIYFARNGIDPAVSEKIYLRPDKANRHGFICGATGTGKSVTLKVLAESFSQLGVPVFMSDVKGDMAGIAVAGDDSEGMQKRLDRFGIRDVFTYEGYPVSIFDIYCDKGTPLRTTVSEMGPQLFSQVLDLNDTQTELMQVIFKIADDLGLVLIDTKDMKAMLQYAADHNADFKMDYGNIPQQSASAIIRAIVALEAEGADKFFGEPAVDIRDFFLTAPDGRGIINILDAETLINKPRLYSAFMLYLLSELFEVLPEVGDPEKPKMVFFFDEAHLLFKNASKSLLEKIEQVVKLIRSKGVSIFFVTQSPGDIPNAVMAQLGNKIEHGLHAYTPAEQKVVKAAAEAFRVNPAFDTEELLQNLATGEAVVSVLDEKGAPSMAQHAFVLPPESRMGPLEDAERAELVQNSILNSKYETMIDQVSAYEVITGKAPAAPAASAGGGYTYSADFNTPVQAQASGETAAAEQPAQSDAELNAAADGEITIDIETEVARQHEELSSKFPQEEEPEQSRKKSSSKAAAKAESAEEEGGSALGNMADSFLGKSGTRQVMRSTGGSIGREIGKTIGEAVLGKKGRTIGGNIGSAIGRNLFGTLSKRK